MLSNQDIPPELQPQPAPANPPRGEPVWPIAYPVAEAAGASTHLLRLMRSRDAQGRAKYGVPLCVGDGRDTSLDALQEAIDLVVYSVKAGREAADATRGSWFRIAVLATDIADEILRLRAEVKPQPTIRETVMQPADGMAALADLEAWEEAVGVPRALRPDDVRPPGWLSDSEGK